MPTGACLSELLAFATCDVFTKTPYSGNPLAIVEGADGLSDAQMLKIAREFNLSETIFVQRPDDPENSAKVRIFFPTAEIPFAGHPTIGCAIHLALKSAPDGDFETTITLEEVAGLVPVLVSRVGKDVTAEFRAPVIPHAPERGVSPDKASICQALGLSEEQLSFGAHMPGLWQGGPKFLYLPVRDLAALAQARPQEPGWSALMALADVDSAYLYTPGNTPGADCDFRARMFSPTAGIPEDPATGSASAIFAAQLLASGALTDRETQLTLHQGVEMGRASEIGLRITLDDHAITDVHVRGSAVAISAGEITPPAA